MYAVMLYVDKKGSKALEILEILAPPCCCYKIIMLTLLFILFPNLDTHSADII